MDVPGVLHCITLEGDDYSSRRVRKYNIPGKYAGEPYV